MRSSPPNIMEGRKCIIYLPDNRKLVLTVNGRQSGKDLWDDVRSELHLREEYYFGLKFKTTGEHYAWIEDDKKVLDHDIEMKSTDFPLEFIFCVRCYEDSVTVHKYPSTVEFIFLHAQNLMYNGEIYVPPDLSLELSAYSLQAFYGDFVSEEIASSNFRNLSCLPRSVIQELPSIEYCEEQVISWYKNLQGISRGQAILFYMSKVEKIPDYGVHFFKVKDKGKSQFWLGICNKGIFQYPGNDRSTPNLRFLWRNLKNLFFREKKFSVEVCAGHKRALSTGSTSAVAEKSKKGDSCQLPAKTYSWYGSPSLIKSIWLMAIAQHRFYWHKKQSSRSKSQTNKTNATNLRNALDHNPKSIVVPPKESGSAMQKKGNRKNTPSTSTAAEKAPLKVELEQQSPEVIALEKKMISDLEKRKLDLEDQLYDKVQELKSVCQEELNLTRRIPVEYIRYLLPWEDRPTPVKKIGASFPVQLRRNNNNRLNRNDDAELQKLESECELLNQIAKAAYKLASDHTFKGRTKKKRLESYRKSLKKLQDVENRIDEIRKNQGRDAAFRQSTLIMTNDLDIMSAIKDCSIDDISERSSLSEGVLLDDEASCSSGAEARSTHSTPALSSRPISSSADVDMEDIKTMRSRTPPATRSTKVAWIAPAKPKSDSLSPNNSYPVLPSPTSYRSTTSHSSGTDTPPTLSGHSDQSHLRWAAPRQKNNHPWKESSLDSLESDESRRSNDRTARSPVKRRGDSDAPRANALRIAKATELRALKESVQRGRSKSQDQSNQLGTVNPVVDIVKNTIQDERNDSRTSLTDSGHGTDSRVPSYYEDDTLQRKKDRYSIRRDVSDSSLSELSTKSNPLPTNIPKFMPTFMRGRSVTHNGPHSISEVDEDSRMRKRSSSFTETVSSPQHLNSQKDSTGTLTKNKNKYEFSNIAMDPSYGGSPSNDAVINSESEHRRQRHQLQTSQSSNELQPTVFETNSNIRKQYLSRSQGQLTAQNENNHAQPLSEEKGDATDAPAIQYVSGLDKPQHPSGNPMAHRQYTASSNNSNNKLNFGQLYRYPQVQYQTKQFYQGREHCHSPHDVVVSNNIPKCNSLDSILDGRAQNTQTPSQQVEQQRQYRHREQVTATPTPPLQYNQHHSSPRPAGTPDLDTTGSDQMTDHDRDKYNNEAFEEIRGMGWVPSLHEYGSRASVADSLPAKSKREDIRELLRQQFMHRPKRTPSAPNAAAISSKKERERRARMRGDMMRHQEPQSNTGRPTTSDEATWEEFKNNLTLKRPQNQEAVKSVPKSDRSGVNIFAHKQPPPLTQANTNNYMKIPDATSSYAQSTIHKRHNRNGYVAHMNPSAADEHRRETLSSHSILSSQPKHVHKYRQKEYFYQPNSQAQERFHQGKDDDHEARAAVSESEDGATVIQETRTSPNGHKVSVFSVTKSAPSSPKTLQSAEPGKFNPFFKSSTLDRNKVKESLKTASKDQLSPASDNSDQADFLQALAIEAARSAQIALSASQGNLDQLSCSKDPPPLPSIPPNSLRSSLRARHGPNEYDMVGRTGRIMNQNTNRCTNIPETKTPRSRSKTRRDGKDLSTGHSAVQKYAGKNGAALPISDSRSRSKTVDSLQGPEPSGFQRTYSIPTRTKPSTFHQNSSPKSNRITGMYDGPLMGAKLRPPAGPRVTASTPTPTRSTKITANTLANQFSGTSKPTLQLGQSDTLPRTPKSSHRRLERCGSTSGPVYQSNEMTKITQSSRDSRPQAAQPSPKKENYRFLANEELKYKRSLSETWNRPLGAAAPNIAKQYPVQPHSTVTAMHDQRYPHHHHPHHMYQIPRGPPSNMDPHISHDQPRRTASADDLLWSADPRESNANLRSQEGTLV